ncbi:MAG: NADH-quinone oxidoreductase subunit M, partial [Planctomycetes bacterium]|nr:NADH-quinone oxidoreductase subunit M [Planctomycetota bacterium]
MQFLAETQSTGIPHILSVITFLPAVGAVLIALFIPSDKAKEIKYGAFFFSAVTAAASLVLIPYFNVGEPMMQLTEDASWIDVLNIRYSMGIDGISLVLVLLTTLMTPVVMASASGSIEKRVKEYFVSMLILETGMIGAFCAMDLFLFYVFFEVMLVPMYLLIGVWGGPNRVYAAVKFFIYTLFGSLLMFLAILYCYNISGDFNAGGGNTFAIQQLMQALPQAWEAHPTAATLCFLAFMLSFAIKTPMFPVHTWLPDAHTEAPTGGSVMLAAVMLKFGTYGMLRFGIGFFPEQA